MLHVSTFPVLFMSFTDFLNETEYCCRKFNVPAIAKPAALATITNLIATLPAHAEAGKIFDFNLTLPIMVTEFLLLMVFLEKTWFTPVGKVLDKRDKDLREKLGSVKVRLFLQSRIPWRSLHKDLLFELISECSL